MAVILVSIVFCLLGLEVLRRLAPVWGLMDHPGAHRHHEQPTPLVGGIAIGLILSVQVLVDGRYPGMGFGLLIMLVTGIIDDRTELSPVWRFGAQILAAYLVVKLDGLLLTDLGELLPGQQVYLNQWSQPLTIFAIVGVINALNMSDGMDGLLGSIVIIVTGYLLYIGVPEITLLQTLCATVAVFLAYNLKIGARPARVYLGDAGSTVLGFTVACLMIRHTQPDQSIFSPVAALWVIALPLIDAVAVMVARPVNGKSPFSADKNHYHHFVLSKVGSINLSLILIILISGVGLMVASATTSEVVAEPASFGLFMVLFVSWLIVLLRVGKHQHGVKARDSDNPL